MASMLGKEPDFQRCLVHLWITAGQPTKLRKQYNLLVEAAGLVLKTPRSVATANLCVNALGLGVVSTLLNWGVLAKNCEKASKKTKKTKATKKNKNPKNNTSTIRVLDSSTVYRIIPWSAKVAANLQPVLNAATALNHADCPQSLEQWATVVVALSTAVSFPGGSAASAYVRPWLIRTRLLVECRACNIKQLTFTGEDQWDANCLIVFL